MPVARAANSASFELTVLSDCEIQMTRLFDAPRRLVFEAMSKPEHIVRWWGCLGEGYSVPVCEVDLRPAGRWRFVNRYPGGEAAFHGVYREVTPPDRIVFTEIYEAFPDVETVVTSTLAEENGKTRLKVVVAYPSIEVRDQVLKSGMEHGAAKSYDRLDEIAMELTRS